MLAFRRKAGRNPPERERAIQREGVACLSFIPGAERHAVVVVCNYRERVMYSNNLIEGWFLDAARAMYPLAELLYHDWYQLFVFFLFTSFCHRLARVVFQNMSLVGVPQTELDAARQRYPDGITYAFESKLDSPPRDILVCRRMYRYAYRATGLFSLFYLALFTAWLWVGLCVDMLGTPYALNNSIRWLFLPENHFGVAWIIGGLIVGKALSRWVRFMWVDEWLGKEDQRVNSQIAASRKKTTQRKGELTDVRTLSFGDRVEFNPLDYFSEAKARNAVFLGMDDKGEPLYVPREVWQKTNIQILGVPGSGKSVMATNALVQCAVSYGDAVVYFDPKNDEFAPHVFRAHCERFQLVDLRKGKPAQINPFGGISTYELENLLIVGFNLSENNDIADFHKVNEQHAAKLIARQFPGGDADIQRILAAASLLPDDLRKEAKGFLRKLGNVAELSVLQTHAGVDIDAVLNGGGVLYVVGSTEDESVIRLQKMLYARCVLAINAREHPAQVAHVNLMVDEIKYLLSRFVVNALGTIRSKGAHQLLAHQSLGDFGQCGGDLDPDFVKTGVTDNTPIRWFYRASNFESAEWASQQTGQILVDTERRQVSAVRGNAELVGHDVQLQQEKRYLFDTNMIQHMPDGFAVLTGLGTAKQAFTHHIAVTPAPLSLYDAPALVQADPMAAIYDDLPDATESAVRDYCTEGMQWGGLPPENPVAADTGPDKGTKPNVFEELY